jgi:hypothetical protein
MRFWETLSRAIYRFAGTKQLAIFRENSLESVLADSVRMLDPETLEEMKAFLKGQQTASGGFADRGGKCDLYYSLFGLFVSEALGMHEVVPSLKRYIREISQTGQPEGIHWHCAVILYAKLFGVGELPPTLRQRPKAIGDSDWSRRSSYSLFINLLTFYYTEDYYRLYQTQRELRKIKPEAEMPCPVTAANLVLQHSFGIKTNMLADKLISFYRNDGSFSAVKNAPIGDLLSTGVALYAMKFIRYDLRILKPGCLEYVDSLYDTGGFCATLLDPDRDVEYTFYGLLALGALAE